MKCMFGASSNIFISLSLREKLFINSYKSRLKKESTKGSMGQKGVVKDMLELRSSGGQAFYTNVLGFYYIYFTSYVTLFQNSRQVRS